MLFRLEPDMNYQPTPEELAGQKQQWGAWIGGIASQSKLVTKSQLGFSGKQLRADLSVKEGIHLSEKQTLGGTMLVKAKDMDEVLAIARACPVLQIGGSVEIRTVIPMS